MEEKKKKLRLDPEVRKFAEKLNDEFKRVRLIMPEELPRFVLKAAICSVLKGV